MIYPLAPERFPGIKTARIAAYGTNGTSPQNATIQLPEYGVYLALVQGTFTNGNNKGTVAAIIQWWKFDAAGGSANTIAQTALIGSPVFSAGGSGTTLNSLTVSNPSAAGVVTVGIGWSDTATARTPWATVTLRKIADTNDFLATP